MEIGMKIGEIRKKQKLTQEEFAKPFHVTRQTVSNWENEKSYPDLQTLIAISDMFDVSLDEMLKEDKNMLKKIDTGIKTSRILKKLFIAICALVVIAIGYFGAWYYNKVNLETHFNSQVESLNWDKDPEAPYYYMDKDSVRYRIDRLPAYVPLFRFDYYTKLVSASSVNPNEWNIIINDGKTTISFYNGNSPLLLDENGEITSSKPDSESLAIYERNEDKTKTVVPELWKLYNKLYKED